MRFNNMTTYDSYTVQIILQNGEAKYFLAGPKLETAIELIKELINGKCYTIKSANIMATSSTMVNIYSKED